jgi:hypothetical protein
LVLMCFAHVSFLSRCVDFFNVFEFSISSLNRYSSCLAKIAVPSAKVAVFVLSVV